jgi:hypothetical protein
MNYTKEDYERIGRAIVERVGKSKHEPGTLEPVDFRKAVIFGPNNSTTINISIRSHCSGCGLRVTHAAEGGIYEIGFESDPLNLLGR